MSANIRNANGRKRGLRAAVSVAASVIVGRRGTRTYRFCSSNGYHIAVPSFGDGLESIARVAKEIKYREQPLFFCRLHRNAGKNLS